LERRFCPAACVGKGEPIKKCQIFASIVFLCILQDESSVNGQGKLNPSVLIILLT